MAKWLNGSAASCQLLIFQLFVQFRENRPTKDYSCKISDQNSNSKYNLLIDYEKVALTPPPPLYFQSFNADHKRA